MEDKNVGKKMSVPVRNFLIRKFNTDNDINDINFLKLGYNIIVICQQDGIRLPGHSGKGR